MFSLIDNDYRFHFISLLLGSQYNSIPPILESHRRNFFVQKNLQYLNLSIEITISSN